jgi:hypothetical protein
VPLHLQEFKAPGFSDNRHKKAERLLAQRTGYLYVPADIAGTLFCERLSRKQVYIEHRRIKSIQRPHRQSNQRTSVL